MDAPLWGRVASLGGGKKRDVLRGMPLVWKGISRPSLLVADKPDDGSGIQSVHNIAGIFVPPAEFLSGMNIFSPVGFDTSRPYNLMSVTASYFATAIETEIKELRLDTAVEWYVSRERQHSEDTAD
jgi:hypothetical protein